MTARRPASFRRSSELAESCRLFGKQEDLGGVMKKWDMKKLTFDQKTTLVFDFVIILIIGFIIYQFGTGFFTRVHGLLFFASIILLVNKNVQHFFPLLDKSPYYYLPMFALFFVIVSLYIVKSGYFVPNPL